MEMPKSPRTVLITGSGRGIGAAAAKKFWEAGDRVVLNALHPENIGAMAEKMKSVCWAGMELERTMVPL